MARFGGMKTIDVAVETGDALGLAARLRDLPGVAAATSGPGGLVRVWTKDPGEVFYAIFRLGEELRLHLRSVTLREPTLEQAFINLVQKEEGGGS